jgi:hypothetical protein
MIKRQNKSWPKLIKIDLYYSFADLTAIYIRLTNKINALRTITMLVPAFNQYVEWRIWIFQITTYL